MHIAGMTPHPNEAWMMQVARNVIMDDWGLLDGQRYLIHDRDSKFSVAFSEMIECKERLGGILKSYHRRAA